MPRKNELEVCHEVKAQVDTERARVVKLTASGSEADKATASAERADACFVKPFNLVALLNKV